MNNGEVISGTSYLTVISNTGMNTKEPKVFLAPRYNPSATA